MILVTGATGFLGRHVVAALLMQSEARVRCLVRDPRRAQALLGPSVELSRGDVRDGASVLKAAQGAQKVVHLVAIIREGRRQGSFQAVNVEGTHNVVQAAREAGVSRLVHLSILGASETPAFRYAHSKWLAEQEVARGGLPYTILRPSVVFGPGDQFLTLLAALVRLGPVMPIPGDGKGRFQPIAVQDVARCVVTALEGEQYVGQTIPLGGPEQLTYNELVDRVAQVLRARRWQLHIPLWAMTALAWTLERLAPNPAVTTEQLKYAGQNSVTDVEAVPRSFGFAPTPLSGNIGYVQRVRWVDGCRVLLGLGLPGHLRQSLPTPGSEYGHL